MESADEEKRMNDSRLAAYRDVLAKRGLTIDRFDGYTLWLDYEQSADSERTGDLTALGSFATVELDRIDQEQPPARELFPGVREVRVR